MSGADGRRARRRVALAEELQEHFARVEFHRQRRVRVAERQRGAVVAACADGQAADWIVVSEATSSDGSAVSWPICAGDELVDRRRHVGARERELSGRVRRKPRGRMRSCAAELALAVFSRFANEVTRLLVPFERREDLVELEVRARAARRPVVHGGAVGCVPEDRAVRNVEEASAQLRRGSRLGKCRGGGNHRVQQRQRERHAGTFEHGATGKMFLRHEHGVPPLPGAQLVARRLCRHFAAGVAARRCRGLEPEGIARHDAGNERRKTVVVALGGAHDRRAPAACRSTRARGPARTSTAFV